MPVYYAVALATLGWAALFARGVFDVYAALPRSANALLALVNALVVGQDWVMFLGIYRGQLAFTTGFQSSELPLHHGLLVPQAWTLGIELSFYAIAPFVLRRRAALVGVLAFSLLLRVALWASGLAGRDPWSYRFFPTELAFFMLGALADLALLPRWQRWHEAHSRRGLPRLASAGLCGLVVCYPLLPLASGLKMAMLFAVSWAALPLLFGLQAESKLDRSVGELSYPVYIGHILVSRVVHRALYHLGGASPLLQSLLNVRGAVAFAIVLNALVAAPMERLRARVKQGAAARPAG